MKTNLVATQKVVSETPESSELSVEELTRVISGGSASSGTGAGKVTFNPFSITRKID